MEKIYRNYPVLLIIAAFGPYVSLSLGIRIENVFVYLCALLFIPIYLMKNPAIDKLLFTLFSIWLSVFIFMVVRTMFDTKDVNWTAVFAEFKNFTQPLAILSVFLAPLYKMDVEKSKKRLLKACNVLIILLCINTLWTLLGFFVDLSAINEYFWRGDDSVAVRAASNGRFSGIFNQPMEAGAAYSIGLLAWLYLVENKISKVNIYSVILLTLMIVGGLLTVSKIFVIGGLTLFVVSFLINKSIRKQMVKLTVLLLFIGYAPFYYLTSTWGGMDYLLRFFDANSQQQGLVYLLTSGRYGGESSQQLGLFAKVWSANPIYGEGLGSQKVFDSAFFHFFGDGGIIGLFFYALLLISLISVGFTYLKSKKCEGERKLYWFITLVVIVGSFGAPMLTLNRSSAILWLFICMLMQHLYLAIRSENQSKVVGSLT